MANHQGVLFDTHIQPNGEESYHLPVKVDIVTVVFFMPPTQLVESRNHAGEQGAEPSEYSRAGGSNAVDLIISDKIGLPGTRRLLARGYGTEIKKRWKPATQNGGAGNRRCVEGLSVHHQSGFSSGDGIAMAWRAGCRVANLNLISSTLPRCITPRHAISCYGSTARRRRLSQAPGWHAFYADFDVRGELAPRDIVARAIDMK